MNPYETQGSILRRGTDPEYIKLGQTYLVHAHRMPIVLLAALLGSIINRSGRSADNLKNDMKNLTIGLDRVGLLKLMGLGPWYLQTR